MVVVVRIILRGSLIWFEEGRLWKRTPKEEASTYPAGRMGFSNEKLYTPSDTKEGILYARKDDSDIKGLF